jgi:intraflagellar transport protein 80
LVLTKICMYVEMFCCRALELAIKHKTHVDTVLFFRKKYLESFDKPETSLKFLQFKNEVRIFCL